MFCRRPLLAPGDKQGLVALVRYCFWRAERIGGLKFFRVFHYDESNAGGRNEGDRADEFVKRLARRAGPSLAEMGDRQDRNPKTFCHFTDRLKDAANIDILVTVWSLAEIGADRVYNHQDHVTEFLDLGFEQIEIAFAD